MCYANYICSINKIFISYMQQGGIKAMLNDEICKLRDELNKKIEENASYDEIYKLSVELDQLIAKFYSNVYNDF